jgi:hypothetical protein
MGLSNIALLYRLKVNYFLDGFVKKFEIKACDSREMRFGGNTPQ